MLLKCNTSCLFYDYEQKIILEAFPGFFLSSEADSIFLEIQGDGRQKSFLKKWSAPLIFFCPWGITDKRGGAEYLNITKERLVLMSALLSKNQRFFHQGQKHNILNLIRGIFRGDLFHHREYTLIATAGDASV